MRHPVQIGHRVPRGDLHAQGLTCDRVAQRLVQLAPPGVRHHLPGKILQSLQLDLVGDDDRLTLAGEQRKQPARVQAGEPQHPGRHRIETFEGEQEPAVQIRLTQGLSQLGEVDHSYTSATAVRHTQASSPRERQCS